MRSNMIRSWFGKVISRMDMEKLGAKRPIKGNVIIWVGDKEAQRRWWAGASFHRQTQWPR